MVDKKEPKTVRYGKNGTLTPEYKNWWTVSEKETHIHLVQATNRIDSAKQRRYLNIRNARLYSDASQTNFNIGVGEHSSIPRYKTDVRYNVIKSNIDTVVSKISKNKPKVQFLTDGGSFKLRQKAKLLTSYVKGVFLSANIYESGISAFRDGCVFGTGAFKFIENMATKRIDIEKVIIDEIMVDDSDGVYGKPRCLYQVRYVNRWVLEDLYPKHLDAINDTPSAMIKSNDNMGDLVQVIEAWHLPTKSGEIVNKNTGRHVIVIHGATLFFEPWDKDYFPFCFLRWSRDLTGFFGQGVTDELADIQREINRTLKNISRALRLVAVPRTWVHDSNNVSASKITNTIGEIIKYSGPIGQPPIMGTATAMNQEAYNHLYWLIQSSYEKTGVSSMSATSQKEPGLNAAVAIRTMQDIETERFFAVATDYENLYIEAAKILIDMSRDLDKKLEGGLQVRVAEDNDMKVIKWSECNLDDDRFLMQLWPINLLPDKPEGKLQRVSELMQANLIDQTQGQRLLNYPDLKAHYNTEFSSYDLVDRILSDMLYEGKYTPPEPYFNLQFAVKRAQNFYTQGKFENAPEDNTVLILRFIDEVERLVKMTQPEPPPAPPEALPPGPGEIEAAIPPTIPLETGAPLPQGF